MCRSLRRSRRVPIVEAKAALKVAEERTRKAIQETKEAQARAGALIKKWERLEQERKDARERCKKVMVETNAARARAAALIQKSDRLQLEQDHAEITLARARSQVAHRRV